MSESKEFSSLQNAQSGSVMISPEEKTTGIISYITIIGLIIAYFQNQNIKSEYVNFHLRQMLGITCLAIASSVIAVIPILGWLVYIVGIIFALVCWIVGLMGAVNGQKKPVPVLGDKFQEWFAGLGS